MHMAVFTPEPRLIEMEWSWEGEDEVLLGGRAIKTMRSLVKLKIGGLTGVIASLVEKVRLTCATGSSQGMFQRS